MQGIAKALSDHATDLVFLAGALVLCVGIWWLSPAASLMVGGVLIIGLAVGTEIAGRARGIDQ